METKVDINVSDSKEYLPIEKQETSRKLLWVDISNFSEFWQFVICSLVVFIFFIPYGYLQVNKLIILMLLQQFIRLPIHFNF